MSNYEKWESGDRLLLNNSRKGILFSKPKYRSTNTYGLFFADIRWDDGGYSKDFIVCTTNLKNLSKEEI